MVKFPVKYDNVPLRGTTVTRKNGKSKRWKSIRIPPSQQLEWYRLLQETWCEQNVSNTISYDPSEIPASSIGSWRIGTCYVGVSFLFRNDPTKNAEDLGYAYLPQEVVTKEIYDAYVAASQRDRL